MLGSLALALANARGTLLSLVAGYVDTLGFIVLHGLFTAHVTGNFVLLGRELVQTNPDARLKLLVFPAFVAGVMATRLLTVHAPDSAFRRACALQIALLLGAAAARQPMLAGLLCAAGMGVQNAYGKLLLPTVPGTTVMTGNVTQLSIELVDALRGQGQPGRIGPLARGVLAFAAGALAGAAASGFGLALGLLPAVAVLALLLAERARPA